MRVQIGVYIYHRCIIDPVYAYVYICVYIHMYLYTHLYVYVNVYIYACICCFLASYKLKSIHHCVKGSRLRRRSKRAAPTIADILRHLRHP